MIRKHGLPRVDVLVASALLALAACSGTGSTTAEPAADTTAEATNTAGHESAPFRAPEPLLKPLESAQPDPIRPAAGFADDPTPQLVSELSSGPQDASAAEAFAVAFIQLQCDTTSERDQATVIDTLASDRMTDPIRAFLIQDFEVQRQLGTGRGLSSDRTSWYRSVADQPTPHQVSVEVAGWGTAETLNTTSWVRFRVDVVREGDRWRVLDFSSTATRTPDPTNTGADLRASLEGKGWRRLL